MRSAAGRACSLPMGLPRIQGKEVAEYGFREGIQSRDPEEGFREGLQSMDSEKGFIEEILSRDSEKGFGEGIRSSWQSVSKPSSLI